MKFKTYYNLGIIFACKSHLTTNSRDSWVANNNKSSVGKYLNEIRYIV